MDWNSFFGSLAQAVAAVVGVMAAFLVAILLKNQEGYERSRARTRELLLESDGLTDRAASRDFEGYNDRELRYALAEVRDAVKEVQELGSPEDYFDQSRFPEYLPKERSLKAVGQVLDTERERRRSEAAEEQIRAAMGGLSPGSSRDLLDLLPFNSTTQAVMDLEAHARLDRHDREASAIRDLVVEIKSHIRSVRQHLELVQRNPETSRVVSVVLGVSLLLFGVGVIYPLSFLPAPEGDLGPLTAVAFFEILFSLRGLLLALTFGVYAGLVVYLWILNNRLKHPAEEIEVLRARLDPASYSEYLRVRIENGIPL